MAQFDTEIADGLWDGVTPAEAPAWCSEVASLIGTARGPATEDELAAEDQVVALMAEAILEAAAAEATEDDAAADPTAAEPTPDGAAEPTRVDGTGLNGHAVASPAEADAGTPSTLSLVPALDEAQPATGAATGQRVDYPMHLKQKQYGGTGRLRLVRRLVAVKAVATTTAVAIGITAAAAATGVVVSVVDPPRWASEVKETSTSSTSPGATVTIDLDRPGSREPGRESEASPTRQLTCVLNFGCKDPLKVLGPQAAKVPVLAERVEELGTATTTAPGTPATTAPGEPATEPGASVPSAPPTTPVPEPVTTTTTATPSTTGAPSTTTSTTASTTTTVSTPPMSDATPAPAPSALSVTEP